MQVGERHAINISILKRHETLTRNNLHPPPPNSPPPTAFNRSWEKDCPPWIIHPEEYPYLPFVREHFINQKYTYRLFLRKELGDQTSTSFTDDVFRGIESGLVMKKSAENFISPWQNRHLKFHVKDGEPVLAYYKEAGEFARVTLNKENARWSFFLKTNLF